MSGGGEKLEKSYSRLQEEHAKSLKISRERTKKWEQFRGDYEALQARLCTLPDQLTHEIMVPFGRYAFMPGKLYHSNEIMVLLGDNWFAKRSVKQALEVAERRKQYVTKMLEDEKKQFQDWEARMAFTEEIRTSQKEHESVVEIKEDYDEPSHQELGKRVWKARQPKNPSVPPPRPAFPRAQTGPPHSDPMRPHDVQEELESLQSGQREGLETKAMTDEQLWARLDELERKEEEEGQEAGPGREGSDEEDGGVVTKIRSRHHHPGDKVQPAEVGVACEGGRDEEEGQPFRITVKHSLHPALSTDQVSSAEPEKIEPVEKPLFTSPGDIFSRRLNVEREEVEEEKVEERRGVKWDPQLVSYQGSLPSEGEREGEEAGARRKSDERKRSQRAPLAFTGQVVERTSSATAAKTDSTRKVSQFRASRSRSTQ